MGLITWIVSFPKSGNTWLRIFVANALTQMEQPGADPLPINRVGRVVSGQVAASLYEPLLDRPFREASMSEIAALHERAQERFAGRFEGGCMLKSHFPRVTDPFGNRAINENVMGGAVYIVRDPRDVVLSFRDHMGIESVDKAISAMCHPALAGYGGPRRATEIFGRWDRHVSSWLKTGNPNVILLRYEDMVRAPFDALGGAALRAGVQIDEAAIRAALDAASFERLSAEEESGGFRERSRHSQRFFRKGRVGGWVDDLTSEQVERIEEAFGDTMRLLGYPLGRRARRDPLPPLPRRYRALTWGLRKTGVTGPVLPTPQVHLGGAFADAPSDPLPDVEKAEEVAREYDLFALRQMKRKEARGLAERAEG